MNPTDVLCITAVLFFAVSAALAHLVVFAAWRLSSEISIRLGEE